MKVLRVKGKVTADGRLDLPSIRVAGTSIAGPVDVALVVSAINGAENRRPELHPKITLSGGPSMAQTVIDERETRP